MLIQESDEAFMMNFMSTIDEMKEKAKASGNMFLQIGKFTMRPAFYDRFRRAIASRPNPDIGIGGARVDHWEKIFRIKVEIDNKQEPDFIGYALNGMIVCLPVEFINDRGGFTDDDWRRAMKGDLSRRKADE